MVFTRLYGANFLFWYELSIAKVFLSNFIFEPRDCNKFIIVSISLTFGTFFKKTFFEDNKVAASMGREAFFEPDILISPLSLFEPKTSSFCMIKL